MKTKPCSLVVAAAMVAFVSPSLLVFAPQGAMASDIPDQPVVRLGGMYKITSSNDPIFPMNAKQEWFLDFHGANKLSGTVAVSLRQNPSVRVRVMVWQFYPQQGTFVLGNQTGEGSRQAVVKGAWSVSSGTRGLVLERDGYQMVMSQAAAADY